MYDFDPRTRDDDPRDVEVHWIKLGRAPSDDEPRDLEPDLRDRGADPRDRDPRDPFIEDLELPRGLEREVVLDGESRYELNREDRRSLATIGAFRVVCERDLIDPRDESLDVRQPDLRHLRDEGLVRVVSLNGRDRAVTLTDRGQHLLDTHRRRDREDGREQAFYADVNRPRERSHDAQLYRAYLLEEQRLRDGGGPSSHPRLRAEA